MFPPGKETKEQPLNYKVFFFQPNGEFYALEFDERLKVLEDKINLAKQNIGPYDNERLKLLFVAPEFLFRKFPSKRNGSDYFEHAQKKLYKEKLQQLSLSHDMIIAPGTRLIMPN